MFKVNFNICMWVDWFCVRMCWNIKRKESVLLVCFILYVLGYMEIIVGNVFFNFLNVEDFMKNG